MTNGRFIAVVGPSGVGKDSVMAGMVAVDPRLHLVRRVITRPAGPGEDFESVTEAEFQQRVAAGKFALWWPAHGLHYGIPTDVRDRFSAGQDVLANLSRAMLEQAAAVFPGMMVLSLTADPDVLAARLAARGREDSADIARRLARATLPLPERIKAHSLDNSGALEDAVSRALDLLYPVRA